MRAYGSNHETPNARDYPDVADCGTLGLPSRRCKLKSVHRRAARRLLKKAARREARKFISSQF